MRSARASNSEPFQWRAPTEVTSFRNCLLWLLRRNAFPSRSEPLRLFEPHQHVDVRLQPSHAGRTTEAARKLQSLGSNADPEVAAEGMRALAGEANRMNREHRSSGNAWQTELAKVETQILGVIDAAKAGMFREYVKAELGALEDRKKQLTTLLAEVTEDKPDLLLTASAIYRKKVANSRKC